ncbi:MAG: histidine triad nucleotide-binding protein [Candidatus Omnitrophica bacterium]|nr:histidine triad nucleotide-binding protein [Candidatus Omnitrophota bacterium]
MPEEDCLFCRIVGRFVPAQIIAENDRFLAFNDINPQAPTHVLIVPKRHVATIAELTSETAPLMGEAVVLANGIARQTGIAEQGYRLVLNCGSGAGQSVFHVHLHLLGGRPMRWPPG